MPDVTLGTGMTTVCVPGLPGHGTPTVVVPMPGLPGPRGPAGDGGFTHVQADAAATWTIEHSLGRYPAAVTVVIDGDEWDTDVFYPDVAHVVITFSQPRAGRAEII